MVAEWSVPLAHRPTGVSREPSSAEAAAARVVRVGSRSIEDLQRTAGNQATTQLLLQRDPEPGYGPPTLDEAYRSSAQAARRTGDWEEAARLLNAFSRADILLRLSQLTGEEVTSLHHAAIRGTGVGPQAQISLLTRPSSADGGVTKPISELTASERLAEAYRRAQVSQAFRHKVESLLTPEAFAVAVISFAGAFVASQVTPVGWAADLAIAFTGIFIGSSLFTAIQHLVRFAEARNATNSEQLDHAAAEFAAAVAEVEVDAIILMLTHGVRVGGGPYRGPPPSGLVLATTNGRLVAVAAETIPMSVAAGAGLRGSAAAVSVLSSMGGGAGGGGSRELTDDEKWDQAERALREQEGAEQDSRSSQIAQAYESAEAATGRVAGVQEVGQGATRNPGLISQGYTETRYVVDSDGTQWTVHYNPTTRKYTGAHHSSSND